MTYKVIDSHCHLDSIKGYTLSEQVLPIATGYSHSSNVKIVAIAKKLGIPFVIGISPQAAQKEDIKHLNEWIQFIEETVPRPNAIGEIGLDYHWARTEEDKENQHIVFDKMLGLADQMRLPIVIHARETVSEILEIIKDRNFKNGFMMHFFSGNEKEAEIVIDLGGFISIVPLHSKKRRKVINAIELKHILVETDAPAIVRLPEDVEKSVQYVSEVKKIDFDTVAMQTAKNAKKFFNM